MESSLAELKPLATESVMVWVTSAPYTGGTNRMSLQYFLSRSSWSTWRGAAYLADCAMSRYSRTLMPSARNTEPLA